MICFLRPSALVFSSIREKILAAFAKVDPNNDATQLYNQAIRSLSFPLNRLEKYACLLKEYLHNLEVMLVAWWFCFRCWWLTFLFILFKGIPCRSRRCSTCGRVLRWTGRMCSIDRILLGILIEIDFHHCSVRGPNGANGKNGNWILYTAPFMGSHRRFDISEGDRRKKKVIEFSLSALIFV